MNDLYPEHTKLKSIETERATVQRFLDWMLDDTEFSIGEHDEYGDFGIAYISRRDLMARYFDIDPTRLEAEKRQMLDRWRVENNL